jgi:hypothetical protein
MLYITASTSHPLYLVGSQVTTTHQEPLANNFYNNGNTDKYWLTVHADMYYQKTVGSGTSHTTDFDSYDDLKIIESYGGENMVAEPWQVLPVECTNIETLAKEEGITVDEVYDRKDLEARVFYNPLMVGIFSLGAIKQLYAKVQELERRVQ